MTGGNGANDDAFLSGYRADQLRRGHAPESVRRRHYTLRAFTRHLAPRGLLEATSADVDGFLDGRRVGLASRSWQLTNIACLYRWLVATGHADHDPTARVVRPRLRRLMPRPIADSDLSLALSRADERMRCWLLLAAYQGLRAKEIAGLHRADVVDQQDPPLLVVANGKGGHQRVLPLNAEVERALVRFGLPTRGPVFVGRSGRPFTPHTISTYTSAYLRSIGVEATGHQGRHWFGTRTYIELKDLRAVQHLLGHSSPSTTAVYAAFSPGPAAEVVRRLKV